MDPLVFRIIRKVLASKLLANTLPAYTQLVAEDTRKAVEWKKAFLARCLRESKAAYEAILADVRKNEAAYPKQMGIVKKDAGQLFDNFVKAVAEIDHKFNVKSGYALHRAYRSIHDDYWDPEMFADGQTKSDYSPKPLDLLFDVCAQLEQTYGLFWRRFDLKWDFGDMQMTLHALLPASMQKSAHINVEWISDLDRLGLEAAMGNYHQKLVSITDEASKQPSNQGSSFSIGSGLSRLLQEAMKHNDAWTVEFAQDMLRQRRSPSEKQKKVLDEKLRKYQLPPINYDLRW